LAGVGYVLVSNVAGLLLVVVGKTLFERVLSSIGG
jgi:hypothetical protein